MNNRDRSKVFIRLFFLSLLLVVVVISSSLSSSLRTVKADSSTFGFYFQSPKPTTNSTAKPTTNSTAKPTTNSTAKPTTNSIAKPTTNSIAKPTTPVIFNNYLLPQQAANKNENIKKLEGLGMLLSILMTVSLIYLTPGIIYYLFPRFEIAQTATQIVLLAGIPLSMVGILSAHLMTREKKT